MKFDENPNKICLRCHDWFKEKLCQHSDAFYVQDLSLKYEVDGGRHREVLYIIYVSKSDSDPFEIYVCGYDSEVES